MIEDPPRRIDPRTWPRRQIYEWFRGMGFPYLGVTVEVDASRLVVACKQAQLSLFAAMMHQLALAANTVPQLRQRIRVEGERDVVLEYTRVHPGFTVAVDGGLFNYATVALDPHLPGFAAAVRRASAAKQAEPGLQPFEGLRDDLLFMSCLPWLRFTQVTHPMPTTHVDSTPRIAWGRLTEERGRWMCPVNIQAHHALMDGQHLARFVTALEAGLADFTIE